LLTDDEAVADLNGRFRGREGPTNVLSFPAAASARPHLGDLALALGICEAEARAQGKPLAHHLQHLVAHGVLHLVGFDHQSDEEAEVMEARERQVLASLGIADPYAVPDDPVPVRPEH
jgi:probable rRNA maturation factor